MIKFEGFPYIYFSENLEKDYVKEYTNENVKKQREIFQINVKIAMMPAQSGTSASINMPDLRTGAFGDDIASIGFYSAGRTLLNKGEIYNAITNLTQSIKLKPDHFIAYKFRGLANYQRKQLKPAIDDFTKAMQFHPININRFNKISLDKLSKDENEIFKAGLSELYYARGCVYKENGKDDAAIDDFNQAFKINPLLKGFEKEQGIISMQDRIAACSAFALSEEEYQQIPKFKPYFLIFAIRGVSHVAKKLIENNKNDNAIKILTELTTEYGLSVHQLNDYLKDDSGLDEIKDILQKIIGER